MSLTISQIIESYKISTLINPANTVWLSSHIFTVSNTYFIRDLWKYPVFHMIITDIPSLVNILLAQTYEGCSNMNASSFKIVFTYMLRQNVKPF